MALGSGIWEGPFTFASRFEDGDETNPEELIGAAHAGCFSMAFANELDGAGFAPESVETEATVTLDQVDGDFTITKIHLVTEASVPDIDEDEFQEIAAAAKEGCPVSKVLAGAEITLDATLA
jgi:osmotically inducible protein OsmC